MKREKLKKLYDIARESGITSSKKDFANLIGIAPGTLSYALTGSNTNVNVENIISKAEDALRNAGVDISGVTDSELENTMQNISGSNNTNGIPPKNFDHDAQWFALVAEKDKQITDLLRLSTSLSQQNQLLIEKLTK